MIIWQSLAVHEDQMNQECKRPCRQIKSHITHCTLNYHHVQIVHMSFPGRQIYKLMRLFFIPVFNIRVFQYFIKGERQLV